MSGLAARMPGSKLQMKCWDFWVSHVDTQELRDHSSLLMTESPDIRSVPSGH